MALVLSSARLAVPNMSADESPDHRKNTLGLIGRADDSPVASLIGPDDHFERLRELDTPATIGQVPGATTMIRGSGPSVTTYLGAPIPLSW
ncbi:MAG TPA: hypothetical protein VE690_13695 [Rhodopila sp.]|nr:hypothetical protein [Rhodopila sp.]